MLTLKIFHGSTNQVTYFGGLSEVSTVGQVYSEAANTKENAIYNGEKLYSEIARIVEPDQGWTSYTPELFTGERYDLKVLRIRRPSNKSEYLTVEAGRVFLMGPDGATLDRI